MVVSGLSRSADEPSARWMTGAAAPASHLDNPADLRDLIHHTVDRVLRP